MHPVALSTLAALSVISTAAFVPSRMPPASVACATARPVTLEASRALQDFTPGWRGPDGQQLPFTNGAQILEFLRTADVIGRSRIEVGINETSKLLLEKNGVRAHAIFRDVDVTAKNQRVGSVMHLVFRDYYKFDPAAYELAVLLGMDNVPPAVVRPLDGIEGSVQLWVEGARAIDVKDFRPPSPLAWSKQLWTMHLFDALIFNVDRNHGNWLVDDRYKLWLIDHGRAFQRKSDLRGVDEFPLVDRRIWERLQGLDEATVTAALGAYLNTAEIRSLMNRHRMLVEHIADRIAELGEGSVLY